MPEGAEQSKSVPKSVSKIEQEVKPNARKEFSELTPPEKVKAILAGAGKPVSQQLIYEFAGIEPDDLTDKQKKAVDGILQDPQVQRDWSEEFKVEQYHISSETQKAIFQELMINQSDVKLQIADSISSKLFGRKK
jgi:hypothetical protein